MLAGRRLPQGVAVADVQAHVADAFAIRDHGQLGNMQRVEVSGHEVGTHRFRHLHAVTVPGVARVDVAAEGLLQVHHLQCHGDSHEPGQDLSQDRELAEHVDVEHGRSDPHDQVGAVDAGLLDPDREDFLGGEVALAHEDDQEQHDGRPVAGDHHGAEDDAREQREPHHVLLSQRLEVAVGDREGCRVVHTDGHDDRDDGHDLVADRHELEADHGRQDHREEGHEHRHGVRDPVEAVVPLFVAEDLEARDHADRSQCAGDTQHRRDGVAAEHGEAASHDDGHGHAEDELAPALGPDGEQVLDGTELHAAPLERDPVERPGEQEVDPVLLQGEGEVDLVALGRLHQGVEALGRVGAQEPHGQHVHAKHGRVHEDVLPARLVPHREDRHEGGQDRDQRPGGEELTDQGHACEQEPADQDAIGDLHVEQLHAGHQHGADHDRDEDDVVVDEHVVELVQRQIDGGLGEAGPDVLGAVLRHGEHDTDGDGREAHEVGDLPAEAHGLVEDHAERAPEDGDAEDEEHEPEGHVRFHMWRFTATRPRCRGRRGKRKAYHSQEGSGNHQGSGVKTHFGGARVGSVFQLPDTNR